MGHSSAMAHAAQTPLTDFLPMEKKVLLQAEGLNLDARINGKTCRVLRDISFTLEAGKTLGLVGESGAGKSMLGRILSRQLPSGFNVSSGSLVFDGEDLLAASDKQHREWLGRRIAFIPQEPMTALNPVLTIGQQFSEHMHRIGIDSSDVHQRMVHALSEVLLPEPEQILDKYAFQLSGGMCQRVMIAMAFASEPDLVISDEATTALDVSTQAQVVKLLRQMQQKKGTSVIFVTHDMGLATHVCDEVAVLYAGEMMERADAKKLLTQASHPYTRALTNATPELEGELYMLDTLDGQMPGVESFADITGCRFAERCQFSQASCRDGVPALQVLSDTHSVRCIRLDELEQQTSADDKKAHATGAPFSDRQILSVTGLSKIYKAGNSKQQDKMALAPMDFHVSPGEFIGIVGESGSGKSTLGRLLMGLEEPTSGEFKLNGAVLGNDEHSWQKRRSLIQMIFQDARSALNPRRKVGKLLTQMMDSRPHQRLERQRRMYELANDVGLSKHSVGRYPTQLSGGQRQRVNIGRSLCDLPQILIADEIVSGLDVSVQAQIMNLLLELRREHKVALVLISHDLSVVRYLCSRILVMKDGEVVESGNTQEVLKNPQHPYTRKLIAAVPPTDPDAVWPADICPADNDADTDTDTTEAGSVSL
ncbi:MULTISPECIES: ABC transporter ATP-binding protein [unclassified Thalassolituus]|uniref:ABC transporter ATP-binding protein n=1 Tax=unclassified Thalassolituus TaxID=2624967 RepID=UPI0025EFEC38|nr:MULTISPECIES: ABC transporter ATP-binding protein [unclassified Thalassolituus]